MSVSFRRGLVAWVLAVILPASLLGQTPSAILHTQGGVWVNGYEAKDAAAIFTGDLIETKPGFSAELNLDGTSVMIQPQAVLKFQGDQLTLDHGGVSVGTTKSFKVLVNCITVIPVINEWTQYDVVDVNGTVQVSAHKLDVNVDHGNERQKAQAETQDTQKASVHEGEQRNYDEKEVCGAALKPTGAGGLLNPKWIAVGAGGVGVLIWILVHGGNPQTPMSVSRP